MGFISVETRSTDSGIDRLYAVFFFAYEITRITKLVGITKLLGFTKSCVFTQALDNIEIQNDQNSIYMSA